MRDWISPLIDLPGLRILFRRVRTRELRLALMLCLPAAVLAVVLRAWLLAHMPAAFVHNDTCTIIQTADRLLNHGAFEINNKKTFLEPLLYCVPALMQVPVLSFLAVVQHLLGVLGVFLGGLLVFAWCRYWRWLIVPATLVIALDPVLLWYEHAALAETYAITGILIVALTATAFYRAPERHTFASLLLAVLFMAGARPEGRLFALFALVLVVRVWWGNWPMLRIGLAISLLWAVAIFALTRTGQSGLLLFASLLHLSPPHLTASPGIAEKLAPLAETARAGWAQRNPPRLVSIRKQISKSLDTMQAAAGLPLKEADARVNSISTRAGLEVALRNLPTLPALALQKFVTAHRELPSGDFGSYAIAGQMDALYGDGNEEKNLRYAPLLWRESFASPMEARNWLQNNYRPIPGNALTLWLRTFVTATLAPLANWKLPGSQADGVPIRGIPWLYTCALLGLLCLAARDPRLGFHMLWGAFLIALFLLLMVTANIRARFRVMFEPLWIIYALALLDTLLILAARFRPSSRA